MLVVVFACVLAVAQGGYLSGSHQNLLYKPIYEEEHVPVIINGVPEETPEVKQAKAEHFAAVAKAKALHHQQQYSKVIYNTPSSESHGDFYETPSHYSGHAGQAYVWRNKRSVLGYYPLEQHIPVITKEGVPLETPEVLQAKAQHFQAVELARIGHNKWHVNNNGWIQTQPQYTTGSYHHYTPTIQHYPTAIYHQHVPRILPSGVPEDTPEVQQARAQHLAIHAQETAKHSGWIQAYPPAW